MNNWTWDRQQGKFVPDTSGEQSGQYGQPQGQPPGQWPPAGPNQAPNYGQYSQPGGPLGPYGGYSNPYGQPLGQPPGNWGQWPPAGPNQAPAYGPYSQPGGPPGPYSQPGPLNGPYAGQTGFPHQQYSQNSLLGMPPGHLSNTPSNQNQQREMGMRQGPGGQAGDQRSDHRGRGRGRGRKRGRGQGGRKRNNTDDKNSEVGSGCQNEENDESEEDCSDSDDTEIAEKTKPKCNDREPTEPPEENEVFEYLIKEVRGPISVKNIATLKLFPKEFDIPSWFRSHERRFIMFENKEKHYQFIVPFYREATFCLDYNHLGQQEKCDQSDCRHAHVCKDFISGSCKQGQKCPLSHSFYDRANAGLISKLGLDIFSNEEIRLIYNQRFPHVCGKHTPTRICRLPACAYLHICIKNMFGKCENGSDCKLSHTFQTEQNRSVLKAYQIAHWNEPLIRNVIFLNAITAKENTDHDSTDKKSMSQKRFSRRAESTSDLHYEQKSKSDSRSVSIDARNLHRGSLDVLSDKGHGYNIDDEEQMNSRKEETNLQKEKIQRGEKSLKPKSVNPVKNDGGIKTKGPKPRNKLNSEEDKTSADAVLKTDAAQSTRICDLYLVDNCKNATCKLHHHESIKLPYIWQIQIFNSWRTLNKKAIIEVEKAFCQKSSTIQTSVRIHVLPEKIAVPTGVKVPLPAGWVPWDLAHAFELVELKQSCVEFKKVESSLLATLNPSEIQINYIYRVQNRELWMAYDGQRKSMKISMDRAGQTKEVDERSLFHGTNSIDTVQGICTNCFDFRVCGKHGTRYGKGAYFARDAKYSHRYTGSSSTSTDRYMFLAKVLVGEYTIGSSTYTRPPEKPGATAHQLFDSCVDIVDNPSIFVIFDLKQCYPEYLICYKNLEELSIKETTMDRPSKSTTTSTIEQIQSLSLLNQSVEPKSKIHTRSSSVEKDNVLTRFDPMYSLEKHEEETTIGKPEKNARQLEVTRIQPSSSHDQWTPSASVMHSSSPLEAKSKIHTRSSSVEKENVLTRFNPNYSLEKHEKEATIVKPEKNARQLEVTRIQPSSPQDQLTPSASFMHRRSPIEVKSKIHTRSSSVEKENVLTRFNPNYSLEKHEEETTMGKPEKNARQLEVTRIQPSSSQDQLTPSASFMHRSSPIEVKSKIHTRSSSVEKDNVLTRFDPFYSHEKLEGIGKPENNARQLEVTRIQPSSSQNQWTPSASVMHSNSPLEAKSKIHTRSLSVEKENVLTRFNPNYSLEKHEEEATIGKPEKNARQLEVTRIQPSSSQDQLTPSASVMHRSSPIEAHTVSGLSDPQYSRKPNKNSSYYINRFKNTISSKPLTDSPP
ncbi:hypothetical protein ACJMK2_007823 [Sinanodonta woodiana]|uniref:Uncharacterized protein n=1 Tax=Sinanodonta woodiana TaxID=1069815 RepID=A0ABD3VMX2_SINWO